VERTQAAGVQDNGEGLARVGGEGRVMPILKLPLLAVGSILWLFGLADQLHSPETTVVYLGISALMALVVLL
jgi:hypothetical protein